MATVSRLPHQPLCWGYIWITALSLGTVLLLLLLVIAHCCCHCCCPSTKPRKVRPRKVIGEEGPGGDMLLLCRGGQRTIWDQGMAATQALSVPLLQERPKGIDNLAMEP